MQVNQKSSRVLIMADEVAHEDVDNVGINQDGNTSHKD